MNAIQFSSSDDKRHLLFHYATKKKWRTLSKTLKRMQSSRERNVDISTMMSMIRHQDSTGLSLLSLCLGLHAPLDILSDIHNLDPNQAYQVDVYGASAMHIACLNGASLQSISSSFMPKSLVSAKDLDGSLPIHLLMTCLERKEIKVESAMDIVNWMTNIDPDILFTQDNLGFTPVDIIQSAKSRVDEGTKEYDRLKDIYIQLRQAYITCWKIKKSRWESTRVLPVMKTKSAERHCGTSLTIETSLDSS